MNNLKLAPGVLGASITTYVTVNDVVCLLGCGDSKAYQAIKEVNRAATEEGKLSYGQGKANKYLFAEKFGIPLDVVDAVIEQENSKKLLAEG